MIVLGIDPGSVNCGWGVIEKKEQSLRVVEFGVIRAAKKSVEMPARLREIYERIALVIKRTQPDAAVFETIFFAKNVQSLTKLSHARASAILAAAMSDVPIYEFSPREVKKAVTGRGAASKEQVGFMVQKLLAIKQTPEFYDVTDALAVAVTFCFRGAAVKSKASSWNDFISQNPDRIAKM